MVQLRGRYDGCDCDTCTGGYTPVSENGEIMYGGWLGGKVVNELKGWE